MKYYQILMPNEHKESDGNFPWISTYFYCEDSKIVEVMTALAHALGGRIKQTKNFEECVSYDIILTQLMNKFGWTKI